MYFSATTLLVELMVAITLKTASSSEGSQQRLKHLRNNVSSILNSLLAEDKYDRKIRPGFGGPPTEVTVNIVIKSMGPISEKDEDFILDCYFRQMWTDRRLSFNTSSAWVLSMNWLFLEKVWKPDTYFLNGKKSYLHKITVPNKFLRIKHNGELIYSMRLTIKGSCPMSLKKFPLDSQLCPLEIGSYGYKSSEVVYRWDEWSPVSIDAGVSLAQYDVRNITTFGSIRTTNRREEISTLVVHFHLKRLTGYFLLQVYIPCVLIVSCSWVSFWITKRDVPGRVSLGVTTVLTMTTLGFGSRSSWPRVSYATALDWWVIMCFAFVFASMVEFATINFIEKRLSDKRINLEELKRALSQRHKCTLGVLGKTSDFSDDDDDSGADDDGPDDDDAEDSAEEHSRSANSASARLRSNSSIIFRTILGNQSRKGSYEYVLSKLDVLREKDAQDRFSVVDLYARVLFPLLFVALNIVYWVMYLYLITDDAMPLQ